MLTQQEKDPVAFGRGCELRDEQKEQGLRRGSAGSSSSSVDSEASQTVDGGGACTSRSIMHELFASDGGISSHRLSRQAERLGREDEKTLTRDISRGMTRRSRSTRGGGAKASACPINSRWHVQPA